VWTIGPIPSVPQCMLEGYDFGTLDGMDIPGTFEPMDTNNTMSYSSPFYSLDTPSHHFSDPYFNQINEQFGGPNLANTSYFNPRTDSGSIWGYIPPQIQSPYEVSLSNNPPGFHGLASVVPGATGDPFSQDDEGSLSLPGFLSPVPSFHGLDSLPGTAALGFSSGGTAPTSLSQGIDVGTTEASLGNTTSFNNANWASWNAFISGDGNGLNVHSRPVGESPISMEPPTSPLPMTSSRTRRPSRRRMITCTSPSSTGTFERQCSGAQARKRQCDVCGKSFPRCVRIYVNVFCMTFFHSRPSGLKIHMNSHTGNKRLYFLSS
jgi:hypothetical protein